MRRIDLLINDARLNSDNPSQDVTPDAGIQNSQFLLWANAAQRRIHAKIVNVKPKAFRKTSTLAVVSGQEAYAIPSDALIGARVIKVEFSSTGLTTDYRELRLVTTHERYNGLTGTPYYYIREGNQIYLGPVPNITGSIRYTYEYRLPKVDIRRGVVLSSVLTGQALSSLVLDPSQLLSDDITEIQNQGYLTVVDRDGNILMSGVPVSSIDANSGTVTLYGGTFTAQASDTCPVGAYICAGPSSTTHSQLPDICEDYLTIYMELKAQKKDSSDDQAATTADLTATEGMILETFSEAEANLERIPIIDLDYL